MKNDVPAVVSRVLTAMPQGPATLEELCRHLKRTEPELWADCLPRFYDGVQPWGSYKLYAAGMVSTLAWVRNNPIDVPSMQRNIYMAGCASREVGHQLIFAGASTARLALDTDYAPSMRWDELPRSLPAGAFVLPPGIIHNVDYGGVDFIGYAFLEPEIDYRYGEDFPGFALTEPSLVIWTTMPNAPKFTAFEVAFGVSKVPTLAGAIGDRPESFMPTCTRLVFGLLLESARLIPGAPLGRTTNANKQLWRPHLLGS